MIYKSLYIHTDMCVYMYERERGGELLSTQQLQLINVKRWDKHKIIIKQTSQK